MKLVRSAKAVIINSQGKVLLLRRSGTHPRLAFDADLPGGDIEKGETFETGLVREIKEETGLDVDESALHLLHAVTWDNIPGVSINRLLYAVRLEKAAPEVAISWEHSEYNWVKITELAGLEKPYQEGVDYANKHNLWGEL
ncbi:MAG: hypothetical protein JWO61_302 [Candidatus Saccharibacteria bacterium]|nr:hypothetical protein [Candidatus Saccharibacteria bacterium]